MGNASTSTASETQKVSQLELGVGTVIEFPLHNLRVVSIEFERDPAFFDAVAQAVVDTGCAETVEPGTYIVTPWGLVQVVAEGEDVASPRNIFLGTKDEEVNKNATKLESQMFDPNHMLPLINGRQYTIHKIRQDFCVMDYEGDCVIQFTRIDPYIRVDGLKERLGTMAVFGDEWEIMETPICTRTAFKTSSAKQAMVDCAVHLITKGRA